MPKIRSHYDNLKVSRDAPPAVIKAAYRTLSQEYHPDRSASPDASRIMTILNQSYDVLSDPAKRRAHDAWLTAQEAAQAERAASAHATTGASYDESAHEPAPVPEPAAAFAGPAPRAASRSRARRHRKHVGTYRFSPWVWNVAVALALLTAVIIGGIVIGRGHVGDDAAPAPLQESLLHALPAVPVRSAPARPGFQRPVAAPNGAPWPLAAGYLDGYPVGARTGHSTLAIDNRGNRNDVYIKLLSLDPTDGSVVRYLFVPAKGFFTMRDITPGHYALRYLNLDNGAAFQAEAFELTEEALPGGVRASQDQLTLNSAREGNMRMQPVRAGQF